MEENHSSSLRGERKEGKEKEGEGGGSQSTSETRKEVARKA